MPANSNLAFLLAEISIALEEKVVNVAVAVEYACCVGLYDMLLVLVDVWGDENDRRNSISC